MKIMTRSLVIHTIVLHVIVAIQQVKNNQNTYIIYRNLTLTVLVSLLCFKGVSQEESSRMLGKVSFKTANKVYVKFDDTKDISLGDTLFQNVEEVLKPTLVVSRKSSISCVCEIVSQSTPEIGDEIIFFPTVEEIENVLTFQEKSLPPNVKEDSLQADVVATNVPLQPETATKQKERKRKSLRGRIAASAHSVFDESPEDLNYRMRYTFSLRGNNVNESKWSTDIYTSYRHNMGPNTESNASLSEALRIYSLALSYDISSSSSVTLGRRINRNISNVGAIDGIQFEHGIGNLKLGVIGGSRPGIRDYGWTTSLLEYGGYIAHNLEREGMFSRSSLAFFEQRNHGSVDRRFMYFQHSSSPLKKMNVFMSCEVDLYEKVFENEAFAPRLSSIYLSMRYRFSRKFSAFASYDARKNIIYFETYKSLVDQLIEEASREGVRLRLNWRPWKYISIGASGGYRYQKDNPNQSKTGYFYLTHSRLPWIKTSATFSLNILQTGYVDGMVYGVRLNKDIIRGKIFGSAHFRLVDYRFATYDLNQFIAGGSLSWRISKLLSLSSNYEGNFEADKSYSRVHFNLVCRF